MATAPPTSAPEPPNSPTTTATQAARPRPGSAGNITVCPGSSTLNGTDVSDRDGARNWAQIASGGRSFAFVKATEGTTFTNPDFAVDWPAAAANAVTRGAYHYFHPNEDPVAQADNFLTVVGTLLDTDLPPMLDWEETNGTSAETDVANAVTWLQRVAAASGKIPVIYMSSNFLNDLGNPPQLVGYPLFVANYGVNCPSVPAPWSGWVFWQTSETATVPGIGGEVDTDVFNGTASDLKLFASTGIF